VGFQLPYLEFLIRYLSKYQCFYEYTILMECANGRFIVSWVFCSLFLVIKATVGWAKKRDRSAWGWGFLTAFFMYNLVFWDWIPSIALQSYYCKTQAVFGFIKIRKNGCQKIQMLKMNLHIAEQASPHKLQKMYALII
jgi:hypothetical protein